MENVWFFIKSAILGIVEGITEFLPISSTGHLVIAENILDFSSQNPEYLSMYTYVIQLGAILAVIVLYFDRIKNTFVNFLPQKVGYSRSGFRFWLMIVIACIPGGVVGILFDDLAEKYLFSPVPVAITLFVGGILMILAENKLRPPMSANLKGEIRVSPKQAVIIGLFQCLAIIPGMSRSASTIIGGWVAGLSTVASAEFSFFLAIPVMLGMSFLKLLKLSLNASFTLPGVAALVIGFIVSFFVALRVIDSFISYLKRKPMRIFAIYRMIFAAVVLVCGFLGVF